MNEAPLLRKLVFFPLLKILGLMSIYIHNVAASLLACEPMEGRKQPQILSWTNAVLPIAHKSSVGQNELFLVLCTLFDANG